MLYFSKFKLMSDNVRAKKAYLEKHHKDLAEISADTEAPFKTGDEVAVIANEYEALIAQLETQLIPRLRME